LAYLLVLLLPLLYLYPLYRYYLSRYKPYYY